jgi:hypothetical protein
MSAAALSAGCDLMTVDIRTVPSVRRSINWRADSIDARDSSFSARGAGELNPASRNRRTHVPMSLISPAGDTGRAATGLPVSRMASNVLSAKGRASASACRNDNAG